MTVSMRFLYLACFVLLSAYQSVFAAEVIKISGEQYKLILRDDGSVLLSNNYHTGLQKVPLRSKAIDIAAGKFSYAVLEDGSVMKWGGKEQLTPVRVEGVKAAIQICAYGDTVLTLLNDGRVLAWGARTQGQLGDRFHLQHTRELAPAADSPIEIPGVSDIQQISMSPSHVLALRKDGKVLAWGSNFYGALGREPRQEQALDEAAEVLGIDSVKSVVAGHGVSTALKKDGTVWVWGANWQAQFGNGERTDPPGVGHGYVLTPQQIKGLSQVMVIVSGLSGRHSIALLKDGSLRAWGNSDWGQIGNGIGGRFQEKIVTPKISQVKTIIAAGNNTFAIKSDGSLWAWGMGHSGDWPFEHHVKLPTKITIPD